MNLNLQTNVCDPERLEAFLCGDLTGTQESEFSLHLGACENCRRALQERAAEPEAWQEAEKLLRPAEFDSELESQQPTQPLQIQQVVAALGPTDDPAMLGRLGGYEVSGVVGAGGMGVVLKAVDKSLDRTVAIKVLAPHLATSGAARKRFAREAKAAAAVLHPNVIAIHSVSNEQSLPYLVMPYVRGTSLQKRLDAEGPLSLQEILRIGAQVAAGLAAAHAQGLVHRDIKPANILLEEGVERVTITDFGLARAVDDASITHSGMIAGTPQYMSPEQARGEAVDGRSDLFSLGSVLYAICTGRPPFRAETSYGVLRRITDDQPTPIREINPEIPAWLCQIVSRLMSKSAIARFTSAAEVSDLFEKCLAHVQQPATVSLPAFLIPPDKPRLLAAISRRSLGAIAMMTTFVFAVLGIVGWQATEPPDISGKWAGPDWGEVALEQKEPGEYEGTYTDTFKRKPGTIELKWSRLEGRYKGTWHEGKERQGKISVRLFEGEIRGAWTASEKSGINPGNPELADLLWKRSSDKDELPKKADAQPPLQVTSDNDLLQGFWTLQESYGEGKKLGDDDESVWPHELWIHDNKYTELFIRNGKRTGGTTEGTLLLDQIQKPKQITIVSPGSERRGIYKLEGDTLSICWAQRKGFDVKDPVRPDEFRTFPDSARLLHVYKLKKQVLVDLYDVLKIKGDFRENLGKPLNALPKVLVSFCDSRKPDSPPMAVIRDPYEIFKQEPTLKAAINEVIRKGGINVIRWEGDEKQVTQQSAQPANEPQPELVMNLGFERNGTGSLASASPVLLQKGQIVQASGFQAYLEREKLALTRQHGDGATKSTTIRLNVDREVRFDAVTALMKLCQEVGFQKFDLRLDDEAVEKFVLEILRTPFNFDESKGSWQDGAYEMQILLSLNIVRPQDRVVKTLLKVVDRSEKGTMDQRRLAMMSLGGMAPKQVIPLLIKELEGAKDLPVGKFKESFPYHEIAALEDIGEEAKDAIPVLIKVLDTPDGLARQSALLALVTIGPSSDEVMNAIAARFGKPGEPVWSRAVYEVGRYGKQARPLGPTFVKLLGAKPKEARIWAAQALVTSGFDEARGFDELIKDVAAGESADRGLAATALAALGSQAKPMIPKLRAFEDDPDAHVAKEVRDAFRRIEKDDRIFTHAEEAAKTAAARKAAAKALGGQTTGTIMPEKLFANPEHIIFIQGRLKDAPVTTSYLAEVFELVPGSKSEYRVRSDVVAIPIMAEMSKLDFIPMGTVFYLRGSKAIYIQWDDGGANTLHYYGPFHGVTLDKLGNSAGGERAESESPRNATGPPPGAAPSDSSSQGSELRFSEAKEVVLSMDSSKFMLDLDTGKTMDPPAMIRPEQEQMDLQTDQVQPYHYPTKLMGRGLQGVEVKASDWEASASEVRRALAGKAVGPLKEMDLGPEKNPTYFFKTRDGTCGVLQLLELVEKPKGIRLRYKTVAVEPGEFSAKTAASGPEVRRNFPTSNPVNSIAISPDGKLIAVANGNPTFPLKEGWKPTVDLLDAVTGKLVISLELTTKEEIEILAATEGLPHFETGPMVFSPDGTILAVGTGLGQVKLFATQLVTGALGRTFDDEKAKLAEKKTPEKLKSLKRAMGSVGSLAFSPDGSLLAMTGSSFEDVAQNWGNIERSRLPTTGPGRLKVWDVKTGELKHDLAGHSQAFAACFSADGSLLVSAGRESGERGHGNGIIVWNPQTGEKLRTIEIEANGGTHAVVFSPTKKLVAVASIHFDKENDTRSTSIRLIYPLSGITEWDRRLPGGAVPKAFLTDGGGIAVLCGGESIKILSPETAMELHEIKAADSMVKMRWTDFSLAPKSGTLVIGGVDKEGKGNVEVLILGPLGNKTSPANQNSGSKGKTKSSRNPTNL